MQLHITNGDNAAALLAAGGCSGTIVPWRDVLHEGPVPALALEALSQVRARFLARRGWGSPDVLAEAFVARDRALRNFRGADEVVLWFEHDLYDQLQLAQILAFLAREARGSERISLVCIDRHEAVPRFRGLGDLSPAHVGPLWLQRRRVSDVDLDVAAAAWAAFTSPDLRAVEAFLASDSSVLPFLRPALLRQLQELPSVFNGLGRTAHTALVAVASGTSSAVDLLHDHWAQEAAPYIGDAVFWHLLQEMSCGPAPLVSVVGARSSLDMRGAELTVTDTGSAVLAGTADAVRLRGIDRWYGGAHLRGREAAWRWDARAQRMVDA